MFEIGTNMCAKRDGRESVPAIMKRGLDWPLGTVCQSHRQAGHPQQREWRCSLDTSLPGHAQGAQNWPMCEAG